MKNQAVERAQSVIRGNLEALDQAMAILDCLTDDQYTHIATPFASSSIGQHFRHLADMFWAVVQYSQEALIDYDLRRRGADIEVSKASALAELKEIYRWMLKLVEAQIDLSVSLQLKTEVMLTSTETVQLPSSLERELIFASSHAVHHFALINMIAKLQGVCLPNGTGIAPATASFIRKEKQAS